MIDEILEDAAERMDKSIASLEAAFARIRTGRAHPVSSTQWMWIITAVRRP